MYQFNITHLAKLIFINLLISLLIFGSARLILLIDIVDVAQLSVYKNDLFDLFFLGARFDIKVAAIAFSLPIVVGMLMANFQAAFKRFLPVFVGYACVIQCIIIIFSIVNYFYYQTYGNHIDVFIFGLKNDDTYAVLQSVWNDYPVIKSLLLTLLISYFVFIINRFFIKNKNVNKGRFNNLPWNIACSVLFVGVIFLLARGSLGIHPLKRYHANVSEYLIFNKVTPNALVLMEWANTDYKNQATFSVVNKEQFEKKIFSVLGKQQIESVTPKNKFLAENPPHIVIAVMESLGSSVLNMDDQDKQLLGSLQKNFTEDFLFPRFYAQTHATIDALVDMLVHSNVRSIAASDAQNVAIPEAAMRTYQNAGYNTIFLYGGNAMWRNIYNYFPQQGFDLILDENSIIRHFPEAKDSMSYWGVADEYTFKLATKLLNEATKPTVIYIMTVTNHSPHALPKGVSESNIVINSQLQASSKIEGDKFKNMLQTFRYSADVLGNFINKIKQSPFKDNTIVVATGDHRVRSTIMNSDIQRANASQVPFYLYIPPPILAHVEHTYQPLRVGSHKDIFPTLYALSLSEQKYSSLGGNNLLSANEGLNYWGYSSEGVFNRHGAYLKSMPGKSLAWSGDSNNFLPAIDDDTKISPSAKGYYDLKTLYINQAVKGFKVL